ncbi:metallophosphoesterase [Actinomyces sp. MRS3W]|uniref:metallophosphoesterase n=1 Tax=Actinomyces sp. MRS3W TaxID=2800796 RepID=UPI0028FD26C6|nr:metallophosphoesterase [Actinomyces sp. MRS3W]MDU0347273.1 metallophosphoesterase [Actinomyces sp. MRS3W]
MPRPAAVLGGLTAAGVGVLGYALLEARMPVLRRLDVPVLDAGEEPLTILHLSDLHLTDRTEARVAWVRDLARTQPDVVVNTGDNLSFANGLEPLQRALEPFAHLPGAFVMGDHDYRTTVFKLPTRYLRRDPRSGDDPEQEAAVEALPWEGVRDLQTAAGWVDLTNARGSLTIGNRRLDLVGVDDPHVDRDMFPAPATESASHGPDAIAPIRDRASRPLRLGLMHAPYRRVLDAMAGDGVGLAFAGHTHGGQLCVPGYGALVTNCDLDRGRVSGLSRWPDAEPDPADPADMFLHVSAGLGTSPYTPVRLACRPEATLLTLRPAR